MKKVIISIVVIFATVVGIAWVHELTRLKAPSVPPVATQKEATMLEQVNAVRAKAGKAPLVEDPTLDKAAAIKVIDQVNRNYWAHHLANENTFQFLSPLLSKPHPVAENIARCQKSDSEIVRDWVKSPGHYATMIGDYNGFGSAEKVNPAFHNCLYTVSEYIKY